MQFVETKCERSGAIHSIDMKLSGAVVDIADYIYDSTGNRATMRVASGERVTRKYDNACKLQTRQSTSIGTECLQYDYYFRRQ